MSVNLRNYTVAVFGLDHVLRSVASHAWDNASPCEGWTARNVAGHAIGVVNNVAARAGLGQLCDPFGDTAAIAGDDVYATWLEIRSRLFEALDRPGALQIAFASSVGAMTLDGYIGMLTADALIHSWDIARAAGVDERLDPALVAIVHRDLHKRDAAVMRAPGRYTEAIPADAEADLQTQMLSFAGRTV